MGLFGGASSSKTTVRPDSRVEDLLRQIVQNAQNQQANDSGYTNRELAGLNDYQNSALQNMINSGVLNQVSDMYTGRTQQGLDQMNQLASQYQNMAGKGIGANDVNQFKSGLNNSALAQSTGKASANVSLGNGSDSGSLRRAAAQGNKLNSANTNLSRSISSGNTAIGNLMDNASFQRGMLGAQGALAGQNVNLGQIGTNAQQQAINNRLQAGNIMQQQSNAENQNNWQNAIGQQQYGWNQLNNQLNVLNNVSPMAGYTIKSTGAAPSVGQQILGAGVTGLGIAGRLGAFTPNAQEQNAWNSYNSNGGQSGMAGPMIGGGSLAQQNPASSGWWNNYGSNIFGGVLGAFGAV